jgi:hypothetical protein
MPHVGFARQHQGLKMRPDVDKNNSLIATVTLTEKL